MSTIAGIKHIFDYCKVPKSLPIKLSWLLTRRISQDFLTETFLPSVLRVVFITQTPHLTIVS